MNTLGASFAMLAIALIAASCAVTDRGPLFRAPTVVERCASGALDRQTCVEQDLPWKARQ